MSPTLCEDHSQENTLTVERQSLAKFSDQTRLLGGIGGGGATASGETQCLNKPHLFPMASTGGLFLIGESTLIHQGGFPVSAGIALSQLTLSQIPTVFSHQFCPCDISHHLSPAPRTNLCVPSNPLESGAGHSVWPACLTHWYALL